MNTTCPSFRDAYRGVSSIQPDLNGEGQTGHIDSPRSGNSARRERDRGIDISAQTFGWAQWMRYRNG